MGHVDRVRETRNVWKTAGKRPTARQIHRCEDNIRMGFNPLNAELYPICHLLELLGAHHILHVSRISVNLAQDRNKWRRTEGNLLANYRPRHKEVTDKREVVVGEDGLE